MQLCVCSMSVTKQNNVCLFFSLSVEWLFRDAKIAALEKTSAESERLMAEARNEKIRHMDELHSAQKKVADLEGRWVPMHRTSTQLMIITFQVSANSA